jgi:signal transduction histidine kinase
VDDSCRVVRPLVHKKNLMLRWSVGEEVKVSGDARLLRRAIVNLLANAVQYTPEQGSISVAVISNPSVACVEVADTGKGVAAEDLPRIFDRFYRGSSCAGTEAEGTGLGLAIVKMIAELHGGTATVTSCLGNGSTFALCIPKDGTAC